MEYCGRNIDLEMKILKRIVCVCAKIYLDNYVAINLLRPSDAYMRQKLTIIGSDNGLSPGRRQAIIWTNDGILLIRTFRTHFSEIISEINTFSFKEIHLKMSSGSWRLFCLGLNVSTW